MYKIKLTKSARRLQLKLQTKLHRVNGRKPVRLYKNASPDKVSAAVNSRISQRPRKSIRSNRTAESKTEKSKRKGVRK